MTRPKYPKPDANNRIVVDALEELGFVMVDDARLRYTLRLPEQIIVALKIADLPGQIDWLVLSSLGWYLSFEVKKDEGEPLTASERSWLSTLKLNIITTKEQVLDRLSLVTQLSSLWDKL